MGITFIAMAAAATGLIGRLGLGVWAPTNSATFTPGGIGNLVRLFGVEVALLLARLPTDMTSDFSFHGVTSVTVVATLLLLVVVDS